MEAPRYRIQKAAELSGVSAGLIRAWERRYQLLSPGRSASGYRAFSERDVALLRRMRELTEAGVPIGDAVLQLPKIRRELKSAVSEPAVGKVAQRWKDQALAAAGRGDAWGVEAVFDEALAALPPLRVFTTLWEPLLKEAGDRWHRGEWDVGQEHLVSNAIRGRLGALMQGPLRQARAQVLCACFPEEEHELGLLGAALRLRMAGLAVTYLGPRTPVDALVQMAKRVRPKWVALSCTRDLGAPALAKVLGELVKAMPKGTEVVLGGAGAQAHAALCKSRGARLVRTAQDWESLIG